jgi:endonuclease YncB( thermonuclease family)
MNVDFPKERPYVAIVRRVVDGDTLRVDIDKGMKDWTMDYPLRLNGCNAAEHTTEAGKAATENLTQELPVGTTVILATIKNYKYGGEYVADVYLLDGTDLVAKLINEQWVAKWNGNGKAPVPPWPRTV